MNAELINDRAQDRLVRTTRTAIGDSLRSVTYFTRSDYDQLYLRDDLDRDADLASYIGIEKNGFQAVQDAYGEDSELGEYEYTIRSFEKGFLLRVATESEGVFVTTDALTIQQFDKLATALKSTLETWRE
ncbi:DUF7522 family protein [Halanaeroarchaeum sulfurireducens]|uniref:Uncharacterized protein n=1 Tax=Halanaeroarchaeum sulfurireducens TaxID=1604004 RepID=A0A0F7PB86_9EURY|nr:hypothetical protein [Halanaeroarchaeum sulfurireducens]AKH96598.1 hypothetical protein HLASF_0084 [Halanaeroarchaeum sulfurireducens]ALG81000.1 hypothetical protein HLASA_0084 [Halanaeroarchaeum sulfurireducens]